MPQTAANEFCFVNQPQSSSQALSTILGVQVFISGI